MDQEESPELVEWRISSRFVIYILVITFTFQLIELAS